MESTESPQGVYGESTESTETVHGLPWSPLYFRKSLWTPLWTFRTPHGLHGLYVDCRKYSHGLPLKSMESSWSLN
jgi:hypothetical protein